MDLRKLLITLGLAIGLPGGAVLADYIYTDAAGDHVVFSWSIAQGGVTKLLSAFVLIDSTGAEKGILANPVRVDPVGTTTQPVADALVETNTGNAATNLGAPGATVCSTDTASCSLNQLLQRLLQRITTLIGSMLTVNIGQIGTAGDATINTGGAAQNLFGGTPPINGFSVANPNLSDDCWVSDSVAAAVNGKGSYRLAANGGEYDTPPSYKPVGAVSVICPTTGDVLTARRW